MTQVDLLGNIEHWKVRVCPTCSHLKLDRARCTGPTDEPHMQVKTMWVNVVRADRLEGAVGRAESAEDKAARLEAIIWKHRYAIGADVPDYMDGMTAT